MFLRTILILTLLFALNTLQSQTLKGIIVNQNNGQPIPFAFIGILGENKGTTSDIDGQFELNNLTTDKKLVIQIIGYQTKEIPVSEIDLTSIVRFALKPSETLLEEITVTPKENPANEIIRQLIKRKDELDPRELPFYSCAAYAKTYFTISDQNGDEGYYKNKDTSKYKNERKLLDKQYLFFIETSSERKYRYKNKQQEKILASRVSGFKSAPFASLASQLQSFSFYDNTIEVLGIKYVNPLQKGTFKRYVFEITDTIIHELDTTILIRFNPKPKSVFKGLKGVLYVNKNHIALSNVIASPAEDEKNGNKVKIQQKYALAENKRWFPNQLNTEILFNNASFTSKDSMPARIMKCVSKVYISDINLDSTIEIKHKNTIVVTDKNFEKKDETYWNAVRKDSLTDKEKYTYHIIDSVGKAEKFEQKIKLIKILTTGQIPLGPISIDITKILKVNDYEGTRLGCGLVTSEKLSPWFQLGGYGGYGFSDRAFKYGGHLNLYFDRSKNYYLRGEMAKDLTETANTTFLGQSQALLSTENMRTYMVSKMDRISFAKLSLNFAVNKFIKSQAYISVNERISDFGIGTRENYYRDENKKFTYNEVGVNFKIWPFERFAESFLGTISMGSKWPCFYVNLSQTIPNEIYGYKSNVSYQKVDLKMTHLIPFRVKGYLQYTIQTGSVFGDVPYSFQFNNNGSKSSKYLISADNSFETMYYNEFVSTRYVHLYTYLNSGKLMKPQKSFNPEIELVNNIGYGTVQNPERLTLIQLGDIHKIYTETGIRFKGLMQSGFSTYGLGVFYRYGNYALPDWKNNLVVKLTIGFNFN